MAFSVDARVALKRDTRGVARGTPGKVVGTGFTGGNDVDFDTGARLTGLADHELVALVDTSSSSGCALTAVGAGSGVALAAAAVLRWRIGV